MGHRAHSCSNLHPGNAGVLPAALPFWSLLLCLLLLLSTPALSQPLQLQVQRDRMSLAETLGVVVSSDIGLDLNRLDLSPLQQDFEVVGRSSGTQISMVNGVTTRTSTLELQLRARREGRLQLPPLSLDGHRSQAVSIDVTATPVSADQPDPSQDFAIQLEVDVEQPYVQQQLLLTVRLYYGVAISDGSLSEPSSDNALISRIGRDEVYASQVGGRHYQVLQRRYAVIPQQSGSLQIGPLLLSGRSGRGSPFNRGQPISFSSRTLALQVRPRAAGFPGNDWLPAQQVELVEQLSEAPYRVGEPITRSVQLRALGVSESILPALPTQSLPGSQIYPDQPIRGLSQDGGRLLATLEQKQAIVPGQAGPLQLPAMRLPWWDVSRDQLAWAELPARDIVVEAAPAAAAPAASAGPLTPVSSVALPGSGSVWTSGSLWPWLSLLFAVLWLTTLALWWVSPRPRQRPAASGPGIDPHSLKQARAALQSACKRGDTAAAERAACALHALRGGARALTARELAGIVEDRQLSEALQALDRARYGNADSGWSGHALWAREAQLRPATRPATGPAEPLAPLYPGG